LFIVSGLDHHLGWSGGVDARLALAANVLVVTGFVLIFLTFRENSFAAATVQVGAGQPVISTGPYHVIRHPMYAGAMVLFLATPAALGSLWAYVPAVALSFTLVARLLDEERYLARHLRGYVDYRRNVRFRLIPGVW
jgi:protein-S-isoprenylcysteine O-methyltransferase Ste14